MQTIIAAYENKADGIACYVSKGPNGYIATMKDTDAGEIISVLIYRELSKAQAIAKSVVNA